MFSSKYINADKDTTLAVDEPALSTRQMWVDEFRRGRENFDDDPKSRRPGTATNKENIVFTC